MTSHATTVLIEATLLEPSPERGKGYAIGAPKSSFRGPKAVKSGWHPDLAVVQLFRICLPSLFRTETPLPKPTKGWVISTASRCLRHFLLCKKSSHSKIQPLHPPRTWISYMLSSSSTFYPSTLELICR